jgi:hypothetical protein
MERLAAKYLLVVASGSDIKGPLFIMPVRVWTQIDFLKAGENKDVG